MSDLSGYAISSEENRQKKTSGTAKNRGRPTIGIGGRIFIIPWIPLGAILDPKANAGKMTQVIRSQWINEVGAG
jgi:hypothetical protein